MSGERGRKGDFERYILITGSTDGIGLQTAAQLATDPKNFLIIHGKNKERCEQSIDHIKRLGQISGENLDFLVADFSELRQVVEMCQLVNERFPKLNVLICNAAVLLPKRQLSQDGIEMTFQVNYLSHYILCRQLMSLLNANRPSRYILISSALHTWDTMIDWEDVAAERGKYDMYLQYGRSKLMLQMFAFGLHRNLLQLNSYNSENGVDLARNDKYCTKVHSNIEYCTVNVLEADSGANKNSGDDSNRTEPVQTGTIRTLVHLTCSPLLIGISGKYFDSGQKQVRPSAQSTDLRLQDKLWSYSEDVSIQLLADETLFL